jgi:Protein of unknown function (DUF1759)
LSNIEKFAHLKDALKDDAAKLVQNIPLTAENIQKAWEILEERYDNKRIITQQHFKSIVNASALKLETASGVRNLLNIFRENNAALDSLNSNNYEYLLGFLFLEKLDPETRKYVELSLSTRENSGDPPTYEEIIKLVQIRVHALESVTTFSNVNQKSGYLFNKNNTKAGSAKALHT